MTNYNDIEQKTNELLDKACIKLVELYGNSPSPFIKERFEKEKSSLLGTKAVVLFDMVARLKSYIASLGGYSYLGVTDGSSFIAYLLGATEISPLPTHYLCPRCKKVVLSNEKLLPWDLEATVCECGEKMEPIGFDIPYESFEHMAKRPWPHVWVPTELADKAKEFILSDELFKETDMDNDDIVFSFGENTGDIREILLSIKKSEKLSMLYRLAQKTGALPTSATFDERILELYKKEKGFSTPVFISPEFENTVFEIAKPNSYYDMLKILGAAHGTHAWKCNGEELAKAGMKLADIPLMRDDIFFILKEKMEAKNVENASELALKLSSKIRKGLYAVNGMDEDDLKIYSSLELDSWFIPFIKTVLYMTSKSHVSKLLRLSNVFAWYKLNYKNEYDEIVKTY